MSQPSATRCGLSRSGTSSSTSTTRFGRSSTSTWTASAQNDLEAAVTAASKIRIVAAIAGG